MIQHMYCSERTGARRASTGRFMYNSPHKQQKQQTTARARSLPVDRGTHALSRDYRRLVSSPHTRLRAPVAIWSLPVVTCPRIQLSDTISQTDDKRTIHVTLYLLEFFHFPAVAPGSRQPALRCSASIVTIHLATATGTNIQPSRRLGREFVLT